MTKKMQHGKVCIRESLYTGKFVYGKESGPVYIDRHLSNILNNALEECLKGTFLLCGKYSMIIRYTLYAHTVFMNGCKVS